TGEQRTASVATDASGNFVVVWAGGYNLVGRRFNASGAPQGGEFLVSTYTTSYPSRPEVASDANGSFVVVRSNDGQDGDGFGIFGQRFDATGSRLGGEFRVNSFTTGYEA